MVRIMIICNSIAIDYFIYLPVCVSTGCERDERGRYCGTILHLPDFEMLVDRAILACNGTDCTNGVCEAAIDEVRGQHTIRYHDIVLNADIECTM